MNSYIGSYDFNSRSPYYEEKRRLALDLFNEFNGGRKPEMVLQSQYLIITDLSAAAMTVRIKRAFALDNNLSLLSNDKFLINELDGDDWSEINTSLG